MLDIEYTGEFVIPGKVSNKLWQEHTDRYSFASQLVRGKVCLDVACGTGHGMALLAQQCDTVVGVDLNEEVLRYARRHCGCDRVAFIRADARALPFREEIFDHVVSFETLEHLDLPTRFLAECWRVLRNGGLFICSTPNRLVYSPRAGSGNPFHVREFSPQALMSLMGQHFANVVLYGQTYWRKGKLVRTALATLSRLPKGDSMAHRIRRPVSVVTRLPERSSTSAGDDMSHDDRYGVSPFRDGLIWTQGCLVAVGRKASRDV